MKKFLLLFLLLVSCSPLREIETPTDTPPGIPQEFSRNYPGTPQELPRNSATATDPSPNLCTVTAESLHLRTGAGILNPVKAYLYAGDIVTILNERGNWYEVTTAHGEGWINSNYCEKRKP